MVNRSFLQLPASHCCEKGKMKRFVGRNVLVKIPYVQNGQAFCIDALSELVLLSDYCFDGGFCRLIGPMASPLVG